jgi:SAM-dependent methyltransferase
MKQRGWHVRGVEPDESCRKNLALQNIDVITPNDIASIPDASADVITLWHVLEHVHGLLEFGKHLKRILAPGGICVIAVPNVASFDCRVYGKDWHGYELPRHLYHFTADTLSRFANISGFTVSKLGAMPLDSLYGCLKSEEYRHGHAIRGLILASVSIALSALHSSSSATTFAILKHAK